LAGAVIGVWGYASVFLFALICVLASLAMVIALQRMQGNRDRRLEEVVAK